MKSSCVAALAIGMILGASAPTLAQNAVGGLAAPGGGLKDIHINCERCDRLKFDSFCASMEGGMSANPDGTLTCTLALDRADGSGPAFRARASLSSEGRGQSGAVYTCESDERAGCSDYFADLCEARGGVASTNPDGVATCALAG